MPETGKNPCKKYFFVIERESKNGIGELRGEIRRRIVRNVDFVIIDI
jgi:hypothetical protein